MHKKIINQSHYKNVDLFTLLLSINSTNILILLSFSHEKVWRLFNPIENRKSRKIVHLIFYPVIFFSSAGRISEKIKEIFDTNLTSSVKKRWLVKSKFVLFSQTRSYIIRT